MFPYLRRKRGCAMNFDELDHKLPNGFHDSKIRKIGLDFVGRSITLSMDLLVGLPDTPSPESYRAGTLILTAPYLLFIEPPDPHYHFVPRGSAMKVDGDSVKPGQSAGLDRLVPALPRDSTIYRFFFEDWNSFLYLAGAAVEFSWDDGGVLEQANLDNTESASSSQMRR